MVVIVHTINSKTWTLVAPVGRVALTLNVSDPPVAVLIINPKLPGSVEFASAIEANEPVYAVSD